MSNQELGQDFGISVAENLLTSPDGGTTWYLTVPAAASGGGLFSVVAPWCHYCTQLKNNVKRAQKIRPFHFFYMVGDATPGNILKTRQMKIPGFPMMYKIEKDGKLTEYNGGRSVDDLIENFSESYTHSSRGWFW
jgi:hypothetical protein